MVNFCFPFCDGEMVNSFFDDEMGKVGRVTEIFSKVGRVTEIFSKVDRVTEIFSKVGRVTEKLFPFKNFHSFKLILKKIVSVRF